MKLVYFAWVRERIGLEEERITLPASVRDVAGLISWLRTRGPAYAKALEKAEAIRIAVNQVHVKPDHPVRDADEVALFPPVTGGMTPTPARPLAGGGSLGGACRVSSLPLQGGGSGRGSRGQ